MRYGELVWRGRNLGDIVERLTRGRIRRHDGAHLDPDLREALRPRFRGWRPALGQLAAAEGHLRRHAVGAGDLFLFWGCFRAVDVELRWTGPVRHLVWGWLQVAERLSVDAEVRAPGAAHGWARAHVHLARPPDPSNTLYVATDRLRLRGVRTRLAGAGVLESLDAAHTLGSNAEGPVHWTVPGWLEPRGRAPLTYHRAPGRWSRSDGQLRLRPVARGQEFVLDTAEYPEAPAWAASLLGGGSRVTRPVASPRR